ncbi:universal stress protein A-like protein [Abrus precatorius]|uniref:Universal stress protein A-like protein n=1 Tax=Abrus precatorius TaxID=3816 RepID=A0A8B8M4U0_ABRPR|nr:universal stress protein A-like protein [Abrus precatorius]
MGTQVLGEEKGEGKKVMVAIDESEYSHFALMWVLQSLKESITKNPLLIFMAQPVIDNNYTFAAHLGTARIYSPVSARPDFVNSYKENQRKLVLALLEKAKTICATHGVNAEILTEEGDPRTAICSAVEKHTIDLLVVGGRGLGKLKRAIIGSVSNYCVLNAKCPVLVVKKPK